MKFIVFPNSNVCFILFWVKTFEKLSRNEETRTKPSGSRIRASKAPKNEKFWIKTKNPNKRQTQPEKDVRHLFAQFRLCGPDSDCLLETTNQSDESSF